MQANQGLELSGYNVISVIFNLKIFLSLNISIFRIRDWSIVHLQVQGSVPCFVLAPSAPQVRHIGVVGMHGGANEEAKKKAATADTPSEFHGKSIVSRQNTSPIMARKNGGWAHPKDHQHCLEVLGSK